MPNPTLAPMTGPPFMPKEHELLFFTEAEGVRYAAGAGFAVAEDHLNGGKLVASREDVPSKYVLKKCHNHKKQLRFAWQRQH